LISWYQTTKINGAQTPIGVYDEQFRDMFRSHRLAERVNLLADVGSAALVATVVH
jgi:hypothetical protein